MVIAPAILVSTFEEFVASIKKLEGIFPYAQIDVMDGLFVRNRSFPDIEKINSLHSSLQWELHLMVADPLAEMKKWTDVKNVFRVLFHAEAKANVPDCIAFARGKCWQVGMVLNQETPLSVAEPYYTELDVLQFMGTEHPGEYGVAFVPGVGEKIKAFTALKNRPLCSIDGGVNAERMSLLKSWGIDIFNAGSALTKADNITLAYQELKRACEK